MATARSGEADVWWDEEGSGPAVVLINGLSSPSSVWFRLVPLLAPSHRVITVDNLGTGRTGVPPGPYSMEMLADAVRAVVREAGEPQVHVLGISMGGLIAQELALGSPELVRSLSLVATHAGMPHATGDPEAAAAIASAGSLKGEERYDYLAQFAHSPSTPPERIAEDCAVRAELPTSEEGYANQLQGVMGWERLSELGSIDVPTLVLHGEGDRLVSADSAKLLATNIPGATFTVLPDCGHQLFTDQPEIGAQTVLDFIAGVEQAR